MRKEHRSLRQAVRQIISEIADSLPNVSTGDRLRNLTNFVEDRIDFEGYDAYEGTPRSQRIETAKEVFGQEMGWAVKQKGLKGAFIDWLQGLPSVLDLPYHYGQMGDLMYALGYDEVRDMEDQDVSKLYYNEIFKVFFG